VCCVFVGALCACIVCYVFVGAHCMCFVCCVFVCVCPLHVYCVLCVCGCPLRVYCVLCVCGCLLHVFRVLCVCVRVPSTRICLCCVLVGETVYCVHNCMNGSVPVCRMYSGRKACLRVHVWSSACVSKPLEAHAYLVVVVCDSCQAQAMGCSSYVVQ